ncbi:MAG: ABC-F family ATP-binding cassette domain-containing protein [Metamycoplasmataceae bacterium]
MLEVRNLSKIFIDKKLFQDVNLKFIEGNTYGIIGANGAGKSTFLKIIAKEMEASSGEVIVDKGQRISTLEQDHNKYNDINVTDLVIMGNKDLFDIQEEKNAIYTNPDASEEDYTRASELEEEFGAKGGWSAENDAQILLEALGIPREKFSMTMKDLKSGEKVKAILAKALFGNPDILIMDEPTNHLDMRAIKWLENFIIEYNKIVIVVSHDSEFLDNVCTNIVDIDFGKAKMFTGNYSFWKQSSELIAEMQKNSNVKKEEQIAKLKSFIDKFSANASKSKQATSRKKSLEKITLEEIIPSTRKYPFIRFGVHKAPGKQILEVENLGYKDASGQVLFDHLSFTVKPKDKIAVIGDDDIAKTKFLEILAGKEKNYTGTFKWGATIKHDYFPSDNNAYFENDTIMIDWLREWPLANTEEENKDISDQRMRSFLGKMLFSGDSVFKQVKSTSGGEKARLMFSKLMLTESNFLMFDQPLNHLDTESIDAVVESFNKYESSMIFTTYNKALIKEANVILEIKNDASYIFRGSLEEYEDKMGIS